VPSEEHIEERFQFHRYCHQTHATKIRNNINITIISGAGGLSIIASCIFITIRRASLPVLAAIRFMAGSLIQLAIADIGPAIVIVWRKLVLAAIVASHCLSAPSKIFIASLSHLIEVAGVRLPSAIIIASIRMMFNASKYA
jgi:hypothetical protein